MEVEDYEKLPKHVYRTAPIGLCLFDTELRYRHVNEWLASINGLSVEAHLGRTISEVIPDVSAGVESLLRRVMESGEPVLDGVVEAETPAAPHQKRTFQHSYHAIESDEGVVVGVSCIVQDITNLKRMEDQLRVSRDRYLDLYDNAPDMFCSVDAATGRVLECNNTLAVATGYSKEEITAFPHVSHLYHPDSEEARKVVFHTFVTEGSVRDAELQLMRKDGSAFDVSLNISANRDENGKIISSRSIWRDITRRKRAEDELKQAYQQMDERVQDQTAELQKTNASLREEITKRAQGRA